MASPGAKPNLIIPINFDLAQAIAQLKELADKLAELQAKTKDSEEGFGSLATAAMAFAGVKAVIGGIAGAFEEAANHVSEMAEKFVVLRDVMQQVAALTGKQNNNDFVLDQVKQAEKAHLKPQEWVAFQEQFQSYGGAFIDGDNAKLKGDDVVTYQQQVAEFAKARGIPASQAAQLAGGLLMNAKGPTTADERMDKFGKVFTVLEKAITPVPQLLPQMTALMAQGSSPEDSAEMLNVMAMATPGSEGTHVIDTIRDLRKLEAKHPEQAATLGLKDGMTPLEKIKSAGKAIRAIAEKEKIDVSKVVDRYFHQIQGATGMTGFITQGLEGKGFEQAEGFSDRTPADYAKTVIGDYEKSAAGKHAGEVAGLMARQMETGEKYAGANTLRVRAEKELEAEHKFDPGNMDASDAIMSGASVVGGYLGASLSGGKEHAINRRMLKLAHEQRGETYDQDSLEDLNSAHKGLTDKRVQELLDTMKQVAINTGKTADTKPALSAPPPVPPDRGGN